MILSQHVSIRLAAVGDILLSAGPDGNIPGRGLESLCDPLKELLASCDIVFANLECTLAGPERVTTEPRVISSERQVRSLLDAGINVVTLANNHAFDCVEGGFLRVAQLLDSMGVSWCGAGRNLVEAFQPAILEVGGMKLAFIGAVDVSTGQYRFAGESVSGVAPLACDKLKRIIRDLHAQVDHVIVSLHWGMERFKIPSPQQIDLARAFIDAGASVLLGHHPHVLQGTENYKGYPIAYSLGNFVASNVYWVNGDQLTWNRFERTACVLIVELDACGVQSFQQIPTYDNGQVIDIDQSGYGDHCLRKVNELLSQGVTERRYSWERFRIRKLQPIISHLRWSRLRKISLTDIRKAFELLKPTSK